MAFFGGLIFSAGWALASFGASNFRWTILGVGLVAGAGCGMGYLVPIAVCVRWFPKRKGLVTGVAVAGFGGGAAVISLFSGGLMHSMGLTPFQAFRVLALVFAVVTPLAGLCLRRPPWARDMNPEIRRIPFHALREPIFWMLFTFMLLGLIAGFTVNANLKELTVGGSVRAGIHAVAFFAVANALGRVLWGLLFDRMQSHNIIRCNLLFQAATLLGSFWLLEAPGGLRLFAFLAGLNYGGVLVIYASTVARIWGPHRTASIYGWLASSNIPAALAPLLAGFAFDYSGHFRVPLFTIAALLIVGSFYTGRILRHANVRD
jgi:OFA family oxalate/formate antiporter-like MFS transporter